MLSMNLASGMTLTQTLVGQGTSMGMHECQSRFFENIVDAAMHSGNRFMEKWRRCLEAR